MYRVIVIDEENDVVEINGSVKGLYIATTDEAAHLYSYVIGDAHSLTINKEGEYVIGDAPGLTINKESENE